MMSKKYIDKNLIKCKAQSLSKKDYLIILASIHALFFYVMNLYGMKPISFGLPFIIMDAGYILSWSIPVIIGIITEVYGAREAKIVTIISIVFAVILACLSSIIIFLPTTSNYYDQSEHFRYIFGSNFRVILASMAALLTGNFINIRIISRLKKIKKKTDNKAIFSRGMFSSIIAQFFDNTIFETIAFAPIGLNRYEMRMTDIITAIISCTVVEIILELIFLYPITVFITKRIAKLKN